jgi:hypothetical protein
MGNAHRNLRKILEKDTWKKGKEIVIMRNTGYAKSRGRV